MPEINYLAVLVSAIGFMVIGSLWYGPLFGNLWMQGMGWDPNNAASKEKMKKSAPQAYFQMFIGAILTCFVFAHVLWAFGVASPETNSALGGVQGAFWMWLGFIAPLLYGKKLWEQKAVKYLAVDLGYYLVVLLIAGVILKLWV